jgi:hypothetical protein
MVLHHHHCACGGGLSSPFVDDGPGPSLSVVDSGPGLSSPLHGGPLQMFMDDGGPLWPFVDSGAVVVGAHRHSYGGEHLIKRQCQHAYDLT